MSLRVEHSGRWLRFDPSTPPEGDDIVVLTWSWPEHLEATAAALTAGQQLTVIAPDPVLSWLSDVGDFDACPSPAEVDGIRVEALTYQPIQLHVEPETANRIKGALKHPGVVLRRLQRKRKFPRADPVVVQVTFPDGGRLLHLNLSLHSGTPMDWLDEASERFRGADWVLVGVDYGEDDAVLARIGRFQAGKILFTDLLGDTRASLGMPTGVLTLVADRAIDAGLDAYVFTSRSGYRFE